MGRKNSKAKKTEFVTVAKSGKSMFTGIVDIRKSGMGFIKVPELDIDIRVAPRDLKSAFNGDEVEVKVVKIGQSTGRKEGIVSRIIKRNTTSIIGIIDMSENYAFLIPSNQSIHTDFFIPGAKLNGAVHGSKVVASNIVWHTDKNNPSAEVVELITGVRASDIAMKEIILDGGFELNFSEEAMRIANALPTKIDQREILQRQDFREICTFTIDPSDAKDFDDAISFQKLDNGNFEIGVHIADVSHYLQEGTVLDKEAFERATSVYLPDRVNPMLPEKISNELCSLRPHEDKLCFAAVFEIDATAEVKKFWLGRTVIHSNRRFTYEEAEDIIGGADGDLKEELLTINEISQLLRKQRMHDGAINFSSQEVRFVLDEQGVPIGITLKVSKKANQLIEELMLLANKTVALKVSETIVKKKQVPFPYRVHDAPDKDKLSTFIAFATKYGHKFNLKDSITLAASFNKMLDTSKEKPEKAILESLGIRCMAKAIYTTKNIGHYGLAFSHYGHFTSPIRRYPDVLVHRVLQQILDGDALLDANMEEKCKHCSERERAAVECERESNKYKQVEYMSKFIGHQFTGTISGVKNFGFWVETKNHKCEGLVDLKNCLSFDSFYFEPAEFALIGNNTKHVIRMGDEIQIIVAAADLDARRLDYEWVFPVIEQNNGIAFKTKKVSSQNTKTSANTNVKSAKKTYSNNEKRNSPKTVKDTPLKTAKKKKSN